jgi:hypothetical protein
LLNLKQRIDANVVRWPTGPIVQRVWRSDFHAARDQRTGRLTFRLVNKPVAQGAKVDLQLSQPLLLRSLRLNG